ncbi:MAG: hypothetical protein WAO95_02235 [Burkholderiales bacterium]
MAWATSALVLGAEAFREEGLHGTGNLLDVVRLALYWYWCRLAWQCSANVGHPAWTMLSRAALASGLLLTTMI